MKKVLLIVSIFLGLALTTSHAQALPTPTVHGATLSWVNGCDSTMTCSFNVYRCTGTAAQCPQNTGVWQLLTLTPLLVVTYKDQGASVTPGTQYQYLVYATATVNSVLQTSNPSNQLGLTIPLGPTPPTVTGSVN